MWEPHFLVLVAIFTQNKQVENKFMKPKRRPFKYTGGFYRRLKTQNERIRRMIEDRIASTPASQSTISNYDVDVHSSRTDIPDSKIHPQLPPIEISEPITSADNSCSDNSCSDNSSIELVEENVDFFTAADELKNLILRNNITHVAATDILKYMNKFNVIGMQLPSDSRSFLSTPNSIAITTIGNGQ